MRDPFGSMRGLVGQLQGFMQNPMQFMMQRKLNIPQQFANDPQGAIQHLMSNGQMSQQQYNQLRQMAEQIQSNPQFMQMLNKR